MKFNQLFPFFMLCLVISISSCSKDDDPTDPGVITCPNSEWIGVYYGTVSTDGGTPVADTVTCEYPTGGTALRFVTFGESLGEFTPNKCNFTYEFVTPFGSKQVHNLTLSGDTLTWLKEYFTSAGVLDETRLRVGIKN